MSKKKAVKKSKKRLSHLSKRVGESAQAACKLAESRKAYLPSPGKPEKSGLKRGLMWAGGGLLTLILFKYLSGGE